MGSTSLPSLGTCMHTSSTSHTCTYIYFFNFLILLQLPFSSLLFLHDLHFSLCFASLFRLFISLSYFITFVYTALSTFFYLTCLSLLVSIFRSATVSYFSIDLCFRFQLLVSIFYDSLVFHQHLNFYLITFHLINLYFYILINTFTFKNLKLIKSTIIKINKFIKQ
jgi:hypothetical protein